MAKREPRVEFYQDKKRQWRWTAYAGNGKKVADSAESYKQRVKAEKGAFVALEALQNWEDEDCYDDFEPSAPYEVD